MSTADLKKSLEEENDDVETVTFLYNVVPGVSEKSYGINVAALAGISKDILIEAQRKSREMEQKMNVQRELTSILESLESENLEQEFRCILESLESENLEQSDGS